MKPAFLITVLISISICTTVYGQQKGYKDVQLGKSLQEVAKNTQYSIFKGNTDNEFIIKGDMIRICNIDIDHITLETDGSSIIKEIDAYSKGFTFPSLDVYSGTYIGVIQNIENTVGSKADFSNLGKEDRVYFAWKFLDANSMLMFRFDNDMTVDATNFRRGFIFIWQTLSDKNSTSKMW